MLSEDKLQQVLKRILRSAHPTELATAAIIAAEARSPRTLSVLLERLRRPLTRGCEHLFREIANYGDALTNASDALRNGLLTPDEDMAMSAVEALVVSADAQDPKIVPMLRKTYRYWQRHEEPPSSTGGEDSRSPRSMLLPLLFGLEKPPATDLVEYCLDPRSDARSTAVPVLESRLATDDEVRERLLETIDAEARGATLLGNALAQGVPFSSQQVAKICCFLRHFEPDIRSAAMGVLRKEYLEEGRIRAYVAELMSDPEWAIHNRALDMTAAHAEDSAAGAR